MMIKWVKERNNQIRNGCIAGTVILMSSVPAFAEGTADAAVTGAFSTMIDNLKATLMPIAIAAFGVAVVFLGFKYGRKIFGSIAK